MSLRHVYCCFADEDAYKDSNLDSTLSDSGWGADYLGHQRHMLRAGTASKRAFGIITRGNQLIRPQVYSLNTYSRTMTTVQKSDSEWRAILSPQQVSLGFPAYLAVAYLAFIFLV